MHAGRAKEAAGGAPKLQADALLRRQLPKEAVWRGQGWQRTIRVEMRETQAALWAEQGAPAGEGWAPATAPNVRPCHMQSRWHPLQDEISISPAIRLIWPRASKALSRSPAQRSQRGKWRALSQLHVSLEKYAMCVGAGCRAAARICMQVARLIVQLACLQRLPMRLRTHLQRRLRSRARVLAPACRHAESIRAQHQEAGAFGADPFITATVKLDKMGGWKLGKPTAAGAHLPVEEEGRQHHIERAAYNVNQRTAARAVAIQHITGAPFQ